MRVINILSNIFQLFNVKFTSSLLIYTRSEILIIIYQKYMIEKDSEKNVIDSIMELEQKCPSSPQKRRGRPEKKPQPFFDEGKQLFTIHDNIFHVAVLFYTFRVFDKAPTRKRFNPTIGFSVYEKVKGLDPQLKKYYDEDKKAEEEAEPYKQNFHLTHFFKNSMTFGPKCVIDEFYLLFHYILTKIYDRQEITVEMCFDFIRDHKLRYINFENEVLQFLEAKTSSIREGLRAVILEQLVKLIQILIHTLECLQKNEKQNKFAGILESQENMFERGVYSKGKKKVKEQQ